MKLQYKPIEKNSLDTIHVWRITDPYLGHNWHFHQEFELIYFLKGSGMRIVGDHISNFDKGELVLVGEWLPHLWRNDQKDNNEEPDFIVIKFLKEFEGVNLFGIPELSDIRRLLKKSVRGLKFSAQVGENLHDLIIDVNKSKSSSRFIHFLNLLQCLANEKEVLSLSSTDFILPTQIASENRLQKIINYIFVNYANQIKLEEISKVAFMTPPAFCRYFKNGTNKTFSHFLNEFRVNKSCQLLSNTHKSIKEICYEVGFNSLTNFNRAFKNFKETTPTDYRSTHRGFER